MECIQSFVTGRVYCARGLKRQRRLKKNIWHDHTLLSRPLGIFMVGGQGTTRTSTYSKNNNCYASINCRYTLSEDWIGENWADLMDAQGAFGTDFYDRSTPSKKHRAYYRSGRPVIKIGPKGALGSHEICPIHSAPSLGQSIPTWLVISKNRTLTTRPVIII